MCVVCVRGVGLRGGLSAVPSSFPSPSPFSSSSSSSSFFLNYCASSTSTQGLDFHTLHPFTWTFEISDLNVF